MKSLSTFRDRSVDSSTVWGKRIRFWLVSGLVCVFLTHSARALDPNRAMSQYLHDRWGPDRGFMGGAVYAISQSSDGYLWIGTERGLVRFDGFNFTLVQRPLPDDPATGPVRGLILDADGLLWIRLDGTRLLLYHDGKFEDAFAHFDLQERAFTAISSDRDGGILFSAVSNRNFHYKSGKFEPIQSTDHVATVITMAQTRDQKVWAGTRDSGLFRVEGAADTDATKVLANAKINTLLAADDGGLWIGTDAGMMFWDGSRLIKPRLPSIMDHFQILALTYGDAGSVWVGTDHGLARITIQGTVTFDPENHQGDRVTAIYRDLEGDLWIGGAKGIERLREGMFATYSHQEGLPSDSVGPVYVDDQNRTWFAPLAGGLFWLRDNQVHRVAVAGLDRDVVYSISGGGGEVWIGRQLGGLTVLTGIAETFTARTFTQSDGLPQNSVCSVHRNRDGTVWAGTVSAGLSNLKDGIFHNYSTGTGLASNRINSIVEGGDGTMWFATAGGLDSFDGKSWKSRSDLDGLPASEVGSAFDDSRHVMWLATSGGLAFLAAGRVVVPRKLPESMREQIFGFAEDSQGYLWITTSDHVLRVNHEKLISDSLSEEDVQSYGIADGLRGVQGVYRDRSVVADARGRVWMSLNHGLAVADPKLTDTSSSPMMVRIEGITAAGGRFDPRKESRIHAGNGNVAFDYASISLSVPERIRFRYKLDGLDQRWSDVVAFRHVNYGGLGPGSYRFRVVASNIDGLWNGPEATTSFVIEAAFWQTWWFRLLTLAAFVFLILLLYRLRTYQLTHQLNLRFQERLSERTRIAQALHDTLLQGFLSASMQLDVAEDQLPEDSPARPQIRRVLGLMGRVTQEGRNALQGLRTPEDDNRNLELAFSRMRQELAVDEKIAYRVITHTPTRYVRPLRPLIRDEVYRIGREALVNAFLHSSPSSVEVEVEYASRYLRVLVRDDGCGIDPQVLHSGRDGHWGLPGMRERSESIGASLRLRSRLGAGTEVELTVPGAVAFTGPSTRGISQWLHGRGRPILRQLRNANRKEDNDE